MKTRYCVSVFGTTRYSSKTDISPMDDLSVIGTAG